MASTTFSNHHEPAWDRKNIRQGNVKDFSLDCHQIRMRIQKLMSKVQIRVNHMCVITTSSSEMIALLDCRAGVLLAS